MASKFSFAFVLFAIICLSVFSFASPIKDVSSTTMAISETKTSSTSEHFAVAVQRVDDLVNDNGDLLAERIEAVIFNFDLRDEQLIVNNVPVGLGLSSVQVIEAQIVPANINAEQLEEYADNFDIGLVTVQVSSSAESMSTNEDGVMIRRISIILRIVEIDGVSVIQSQNAVERVLEFKVLEISDGDKDVTVPFYPDEDLSSNDQIYNNGEKQQITSSFRNRVRHWWKCSSRFTRIVLSSLFLTILFGIFFIAIPAAVQALIVLVRGQSSSRYSAVTIEDDDETIIEQVIFIADEEKRALMEHEKELEQ